MDEAVNLSAFAARRATRATQNPLAEAAGENVVNANSTTLPLKESYRPSPAKRRKINGKTGYWASGNDLSPSASAKFAQLQAEPKFAGKILESENERSYSGDETDDLSSRPGVSEVFPPIQDSLQQLFQPLSTFVPTKHNVLAETADYWTICLNCKDVCTYRLWSNDENLTLLADLNIVIHAGSKLHRVYAPSTHSLPSIRTVPDPFGPENQHVEITISVCSSGIRMLRYLSPKFRGIWNRNPLPHEESRAAVDLTRRSFLFVKDSAEDLHRRALQPLEVLGEWQTMTNLLRSNELKKPPAVIICGPKGSGKSTFGRLLANSMLNRSPRSGHERGADGVAFLDLDPGQPEYSPPGEVSLVHLRSYNLGVPFTHPIIAPHEHSSLIRAHHIGSISLKDDPGHYQKCAFDLLNQYKSMRSRYPSCPLIVNCSGWVQGSGLELLAELIRRWTFTDVLYTSRLGPPEVVETLTEITSKAGVPFWTLTTQTLRTSTRTAADLRLMQTLSYFHLGEPEGEHLRWNASLITEIPPLTVRYAGARQDIFGIMIYGEELDPQFLAGILEGCVVGLVALEDESAILPRDKGQITMEQDSMNDEMTGLEHDKREPYRTRRHIDSSSSESGQSSRNDSDRDSFRPRPRKARRSRLSKKRAAQTPDDIYQPLISRTPEDLPYLSSGDGANSPPDPLKSYSIGQALVRGINPSKKTLHLITPIPQSTLQALRQQNTKIVLARGKLDNPTWAYREEYCAAAARRRRVRGKKQKEMTEEEREQSKEQWLEAADELRAWASGTPWAEVVDGKGPKKSSGAKVWKARWDFRPRVAREDD